MLTWAGQHTGKEPYPPGAPDEDDATAVGCPSCSSAFYSVSIQTCQLIFAFARDSLSIKREAEGHLAVP